MIRFTLVLGSLVLAPENRSLQKVSSSSNAHGILGVYSLEVETFLLPPVKNWPGPKWKGSSSCSFLGVHSADFPSVCRSVCRLERWVGMTGWVRGSINLPKPHQFLKCCCFVFAITWQRVATPGIRGETFFVVSTHHFEFSGVRMCHWQTKTCKYWDINYPDGNYRPS